MIYYSCVSYSLAGLNGNANLTYISRNEDYLLFAATQDDCSIVALVLGIKDSNDCYLLVL